MFKWLKLKNNAYSYTCSCCGKRHKGLPAFVQSKPPYYLGIPENERDVRTKINGNFCSVDDTYFFIRVTMDIPIQGYDECLSYGVWVSQSEENFKRYLDTFDADQSDMGSFGWLTVDLWGFKQNGPNEDLESLECDVEWQAKGQRPKVILQKCDHSLYVAQNEGVTSKKAQELAEWYLHG